MDQCVVRVAMHRVKVSTETTAVRKSGMKNSAEQRERWAHARDVANEYLSGERARRLRTMSDDQAREEIARIFSGPTPTAYERRTGLIERQRLVRQLK